MIFILDTTFREGKQSYASHLLSGKMILYAKLLEKTGVKYMEVAYPFISDAFLLEFRKLLKKKLNLRIIVHSELVLENFKKLIEEGVTDINVSLKIKNINSQIVKDYISDIRKLVEDNSLITNKKLSIRICIENTFKFPQKYILQFFNDISSVPYIDRIGLSDTDGTATPEAVRSLLLKIEEKLPHDMPIELHLHNDCGLAGTNFYEAYKIFRNKKRILIIDGTIGGIGERNGILSIADILSLLYTVDKNNVQKKYKLNLYNKLYSSIFNKYSFNKDPLNPMSFTQSSGTHILNYLNAVIYQNINPVIFGSKTKLIINESISSDAVRLLAKKKLNIEINKEEALIIAKTIRNIIANRKSE